MLVLYDEVVTLFLQLRVLIGLMCLAHFIFIELSVEFFEFILFASESQLELSDLLMVTSSTAHS